MEVKYGEGNWESVLRPEALFDDVGFVTFFLGNHRFAMSHKDARIFGAGLVQLGQPQTEIVEP